MLATLVFPASVVRVILQHNGHDLPHMAFRMYHVYLASKKRMLACEEYRRKTAAVRDKHRVERSCDKLQGDGEMLSCSLNGIWIKMEMASLIPKKLQESEHQLRS